MILSRRQAHRYAFIALGILLPLCFIASVWLRPTYNAVGDSAETLFLQAGYAASPSSERLDIAQTTLSNGGVHFEAKTFVDSTGRPRLDLKPTKTIQQPDLLLYWEGGSGEPDAISDRSILLGSLAGSAQRQFLLPKSAQGQDGHLLVYSQGTQTLMATLPLEAKMTQSK